MKESIGHPGVQRRKKGNSALRCTVPFGCGNKKCFQLCCIWRINKHVCRVGSGTVQQRGMGR